MVATVISSTDNAYGLDMYLSASTAAHDQSNPAGPSARVVHCSTLGDCTPKTYLKDVGRVRADFAKTGLALETYHVILSHSHEELDPDDPFHLWLAHRFAREQMARSFPGRQIKIVTQADNGRWEVAADTGERVWVKGKVHSHCQIANVAEEEVTLEWRDAEGNVKSAHYPAGRAFSSEMKNVLRVRAVTDEVVREMFAYDNEAYMQACRESAESSGMGAGDRKALARQAEGKTSHYDELRMRLRIARASATDWDDYTARLAADGVHVHKRGGRGDGVSYKWLDTPAARAGGRSGVGDEYKYAAVVEQCTANAAAIERGEELAVPERTLVVPTNSVAADRPRPVYLTPDGKPPWEDEQSMAETVDRVRATGGTYEGRALRATALPRREPDVALVRVDDGAVVATVQTESGPLVMDVAPEYRAVLGDALATARAQREAEKLEIMAGLDEREAAVADKEVIVAERAAQAEVIVADARTEAREIVADADAEATMIRIGATAGLDERERAVVRREEQAGLDQRAVERARKRLDEDADALEADRRKVDADRREAAEVLDDAKSTLDKLSQFDSRDAVYDKAARLRKMPMKTRDGGTREVRVGDVLDRDVEALLAKSSMSVRGESLADQRKRMRGILEQGAKDASSSAQRGRDASMGRDEGLSR
ncbi:hypothetical protein ACIQYZ_13555 [Rhodococcus erythropolis]